MKYIFFGNFDHVFFFFFFIRENQNEEFRLDDKSNIASLDSGIKSNLSCEWDIRLSL